MFNKTVTFGIENAQRCISSHQTTTTTSTLVSIENGHLVIEKGVEVLIQRFDVC